NRTAPNAPGAIVGKKPAAPAPKLRKDVVRQARGQEPDDRFYGRVGSGYVQPAVEIVDGTPVGQAGEPKVGYAALVQLEFRHLGMFGKHQGLEPVFVQVPGYPRAAHAVGSRLDLKVPAKVEVVVRRHLILPLRLPIGRAMSTSIPKRHQAN